MRLLRGTVVPELLKKYGPSTIPEGADPKRYEVDRRFLREYKQRKHSLLVAMGVTTKAGKNPVNITQQEKDTMSKTEKKSSKAKKAPKAEKKQPKTEQVETKHGSFRKGSVLHAIYRSFELANGATKAEILARLQSEFPDRTADEMMSTINTQLNRMPKERGFELGRDDKGRYGLSIKGRSTKRVLSPEAQAKLDARVKAREEKAAAAQKKKEEKAAAAKKKAEEKAAAAKKKAEEKAAAEKAAKKEAAAEAKAS